MKIIFAPIRHDQTLTLVKSGDSLIVNGEEYDFSGVSEGAVLPCSAVTCGWLASDVERKEGVLHMTLLLPHGAQPPFDTMYPNPVVVVKDGPIDLPAYNNEENAV